MLTLTAVQSDFYPIYVYGYMHPHTCCSGNFGQTSLASGLESMPAAFS